MKQFNLLKHFTPKKIKPIQIRYFFLFVISFFYFNHCFTQSLNLSNFSSICNGSPDINIDDFNQPENFTDISGLTISGSNSNNIISIQQTGEIRYFGTDDYSNEPLVIGNIGNKDYEGITYLFGDYYAACSEDFSEIAIFSINSNNNVNTNINNGQAINLLAKNSSNQLINQGSNSGLEGITYDPISGKIYVVKEKDGMSGIFYESQNTYFNLNNFTNISEIIFNEITINWNNFNVPTDFAGLCHLRLGANSTQNELLLLSHEAETVYLLDLINSQFTVTSSLPLPNVHANAKIEGVAYKDRTLFVCNDDDLARGTVYSDFYAYIDKGSTGVLGDASCNGSFDIYDAYATANESVGLPPEVFCNGVFNSMGADLDLNGVVNINDAYVIASCSVGLKNKGCPCK